LSYFDTIKLEEDSNGIKTRTILKNDAPQDLLDSVLNVCGERMSDDFVYDKYQSILETLSEYDVEKLEDIDDYRYEIIDCLIDVYTSDLTAWLNSNNYNVYYLSEAIEEEPKDGFQALQIAQHKALEEVFDSVVALLGKEKEGK